jgi:branched-chain amino acid aminotransferase
MLTLSGHVSEAASANLFVVRGGDIVTPPVTEDILEGITRDAVIDLAREEMGRRVIQRAVDRSELYIADEIFLCGTGVQIAPVASVDRRKVGNGSPGTITQTLQALYFKAVRGELPRYESWLRPVYSSSSDSGTALQRGQAQGRC